MTTEEDQALVREVNESRKSGTANETERMGTRKAIGDYRPDDWRWSWQDLWATIREMRERIKELEARFADASYLLERAAPLTVKAHEERDQLQEELAARDASIARLTDALRKYGGHKPQCKRITGWDDPQCDCGLDAALAEQQPHTSVNIEPAGAAGWAVIDAAKAYVAIRDEDTVDECPEMELYDAEMRLISVVRRLDATSATEAAERS